MEQKIFQSYEQLRSCINKQGISKVFLICGNTSFRYNREKLERLLENIHYERFSGFSPNPTTESLKDAIQIFRADEYEMILAVGGGSAMDIAKCVKLYGGYDISGWSSLSEIPSEAMVSVPFVAIPTTAGSGSEATRFAVVYEDGVKQSVTSDAIIPNIVLFDHSGLESVSDYQKKSALLDALCHSIESYWSVHSTEESQCYSQDAIAIILKNSQSYLDGDSRTFPEIQKAAYTAGRAINITQTTAAHAMSYKLTGLYGIAHGHAAAICLNELWPWMIEHIDQCLDQRGKEYLMGVFDNLGAVFGAENSMAGAQMFSDFLHSLRLDLLPVQEKDIGFLVKSVNPIRLSNHPIQLKSADIEDLYCKMKKVDL
ncbi:MAG: phosphonoacetaldehyde reductase [Lachnospiraceae bacterium]|nr:phosphonoacetaldehyde reductase [Lachnospiraceae bacterium]